VNLQFRKSAGEVLPLRAEAGSSRIGREPGALAIVSGPRFLGLSRQRRRSAVERGAETRVDLMVSSG
jgi:hypothetical protein